MSGNYHNIIYTLLVPVLKTRMVLTVSLVHIFQQPFQTIKTYYNQIRQKDDVVKISELIDEHIGST